MRTAYLGTDEFAATVLAVLAGSDHRPALVVTPPPSRAGRGRRPKPLPTAERARELGISLIEAPEVNSEEVERALAEVSPDVVCLCSFGQLIGERLLDSFRFLNVHPSLVPRWRGAAPIERAIMEGDGETGVAVMELVADLDAGPVAQDMTRRVPIGPDDDYGSLSSKLAAEGGDALVASLDSLSAGLLEMEPQASSGVTYAEKVTAEERCLDPRLPAEVLERRVRALNPHVGTYIALPDEGRLGVSKARASEGGPDSGRIVASGGRLLLGCSPGALELLEVKPPGGRAMSVDDYLRGHEPPTAAVARD